MHKKTPKKPPKQNKTKNKQPPPEKKTKQKKPNRQNTHLKS